MKTHVHEVSTVWPVLCSALTVENTTLRLTKVDSLTLDHTAELRCESTGTEAYLRTGLRRYNRTANPHCNCDGWRQSEHDVCIVPESTWKTAFLPANYKFTKLYLSPSLLRMLTCVTVTFPALPQSCLHFIDDRTGSFRQKKKIVLESENVFPGKEYHERATVQARATPVNLGMQQEGHGGPVVEDDQVFAT